MKLKILAGAVAATLAVPFAVAETMPLVRGRILSTNELDSVTAGVIFAISNANAAAVSPSIVVTHTETQAWAYNNPSATGYSQFDTSLAVGSGLAVAYGGAAGTESTDASTTVSAPGAQVVGFSHTVNYDGVLFSVSSTTTWQAGLPVNMAAQ